MYTRLAHCHVCVPQGELRGDDLEVVFDALQLQACGAEFERLGAPAAATQLQLSEYLHPDTKTVLFVDARASARATDHAWAGRKRSREGAQASPDDSYAHWDSIPFQPGFCLATLASCRRQLV